MHLETIKLTNFKNYESANLAFSPELNAFVGLNGTGKTNLLDAIYYACMCKSYFLALDSDVILRGADFLRVDAVFQKNSKRERIVAKVQARKRKIFERNDVPYAALSDHIGLLPVVMIAPDDTDLIKEGSEERRRFVDNALSQLDNLYLRHLMFYNKIVEQRNAALKKWSDNEAKSSQKQGNTEGGNFSSWAQLIDTYDQQLLPSANYIFQKRTVFITEFEPVFNQFYKKITDERETVSIVYESQLLTDNFSDLLIKNREKDRYLQRTSAGIHKDNLSFEMNGKPIRKFGSQGQLKSFVIALKLAQYHILRIKNLKLNINAKSVSNNQTELDLIANNKSLIVNNNGLSVNGNELHVNNKDLNINANELNTDSELNAINKNKESYINNNELNTNSELNANGDNKNLIINSELNKANKIRALALRNSLEHHVELDLEDTLSDELSNKHVIDKALSNNDKTFNANNELSLKEDLNVNFGLELNNELVLNSVKNTEGASDVDNVPKFDTLNPITHDKPLLLLDDIFDKLDEQRVQNLLQLIVSQQFGQIFITDTHIERIEKLGADLGIDFKMFEIENGNVQATSVA